jgi:hypothetical protein
VKLFGRHVYGITWRHLKVLDEKNFSLYSGKSRAAAEYKAENVNRKAGL